MKSVKRELQTLSLCTLFSSPIPLYFYMQTAYRNETELEAKLTKLQEVISTAQTMAGGNMMVRVQSGSGWVGHAVLCHVQLYCSCCWRALVSLLLHCSSSISVSLVPPLPCPLLPSPSLPSVHITHKAIVKEDQLLSRLEMMENQLQLYTQVSLPRKWTAAGSHHWERAITRTNLPSRPTIAAELSY